MFVINILIPALSLIISTIAIIIGVYNHMFSQGVMRDMKKHLMYKIPYKERKEYLDFIFTFSLFLEFEDMNFLSVKKTIQKISNVTYTQKQIM